MWSGLGTSYPHWAPPIERSTLQSISSAGSQIGNLISLPMSGWLCANGFDGGWPSIFYIMGGLGIIWCLAWMFCYTNSPNNHPFISDKEKNFIMDQTREITESIHKNNVFR